VIDLWDSLLRTASALAVVLVLMGLLALAARRVLGSRAGIAGGGPLVQVVASGYVAPRKTIALVSVAGEYLIVGTTADDLIDLGRVGDPATVQALLAASAAAPVASKLESTPIGSWLQRWIGHPDGNKETHGDR
jgi:flagellar protein FliO/FliZ